VSSVLEAIQFSAATAPPGLAGVRDGVLLERVEEQHTIRQAASIGDIDYIFFRRFPDGRSSQAAACVIDNSDEHLDEHALARVHQRLWLNGFAPLLYVGWPTRVDILSCARGPDFWRGSQVRYKPAETVELAQQISIALDERVNRFSAQRLSDGTFWDDPINSEFAKADKAAHSQLIRAVIETDQEIDGESNPVLRRLLLLTVLIKYLEDRGVFPVTWFKQFQASSFFDLLQIGSPDLIREMLSKLERKFNGDVFELPEDAGRLSKKELKRFADLVEAKTLGAQRYLWEQYSFRYIPVEVLSHLYQHFAQAGKGAVFTPPMVANLMLDFVMPYAGMTGTERVLDPTCGSGIFLVGAFRRLVHFWQSRNEWQQPTVPLLKSILRQSIFGVELQEEAVHLTAFSLALAVCDALQPYVIWKELRFDKLVGTNLCAKDFSDWLTERSSDNTFSVVVGNPPFMSKLNSSAQKYRASKRGSGAVPDNQMAYFILEESVSLLAGGGKLCLIQPNGFLFNEKARQFQRGFLKENCVDFILDFTSIRHLYDGADPKTLAVVCTNRTPNANDRIVHLTFRRTISVNERIAFELDHYDRHVLSKEDALSLEWIWRANLLGGWRLKELAARFTHEPKLSHFIVRKGWDYGEGFITANSEPLEEAPWLTGKPLLLTEGLDVNGIDTSKITIVEAKTFRSSYSELRYSAPLVLIKEVDTLPCAFWDRGFLAYRHQIIGIHAPEEERDELWSFYEQFNAHKNVLQAFCAIYGTRALSGKATSILKRDIDVLPWPESSSAWRLNWWEKLLCDDIVEFTAEFVRLGQNSKLLREQVNQSAMKVYADTLVRMLGSVYSNLQASHFGMLDGLAYQAFCFGDAPKLEWPSNWNGPLQEVVYRNYGEAFRSVRILRFYELNTIIIVKPDRLRYWIPSTAIRDADETLTDLQRQGH
jgi:N-6 DNA Methylase